MKTHFFIITGLILLLISSCGVYSKQDHSPTSTIAIQTKISSPTVSATATFTPATITPDPTLTQSLIPTLTPKEREVYLLEYFRNIEDCKLPCLLGATPGITTFSEFQARMQLLGVKNSPVNLNLQQKQKITLGGLDFDSKQVLNRITISVESNGVISEIEGDLHAYLNPIGFSESWDVIDIRQLLLNYGVPSSISIETDYNDVAGRVGYSISVYYIDQGFAVHYGGGTDYQDIINICPYLTNYQILTVVFSLRAPPFKEETNSSKGFYTEFDTGLSVDELYSLFTSQAKSCLMISSDKLK